MGSHLVVHGDPTKVFTELSNKVMPLLPIGKPAITYITENERWCVFEEPTCLKKLKYVAIVVISPVALQLRPPPK